MQSPVWCMLTLVHLILHDASILARMLSYETRVIREFVKIRPHFNLKKREEISM